MRIKAFKKEYIVAGLIAASVMSSTNFVMANSLPDAAKEQHIAEAYPNIQKPNLESLPIRVKNEMVGFSFELPLRISDVVYSDVVVPSESHHVMGYTFNLPNKKGMTPIVISFTKRDNIPENNQSQTEWNTTWYDKPIHGLTKAEYLKTWKLHNKDLENADVDGDFFEFKNAVAARWSRITHTKSNIPSENLEVEFIMKGDPKHRYNLLVSYPIVAREDIYRAVTTTIIPSFKVFDPIDAKTIQKADKNYKPILSSDKVVKINAPRGFKQNYLAADEVRYVKDDVQVAVKTLPLSAEMNMEGAYPTFTARLMMADKYESALKDIYKAEITTKYITIENTQTNFIIGGVLTTDAKKKMKFVSLVTLSENNNAVIIRALAPIDSAVTTEELQNYVKVLSVGNKPVTVSGVTIL